MTVVLPAKCREGRAASRHSRRILPAPRDVRVGAAEDAGVGPTSISRVVKLFFTVARPDRPLGADPDGPGIAERTAMVAEALHATYPSPVCEPL